MPDSTEALNTETSDLDMWFQENRMPANLRPHDSWNHNHGAPTNYRRDMRNSLTGEEFFENYLKSLHEPNNVHPVDGMEQKYSHRGDFVLNHANGQKEFEVKLERKGAETGRHALEFGEYNTDYHGNLQSERVPGWFRASKADIVVPVVPMSDGTVVLYPYDLQKVRQHLTKMAQQAHLAGEDMLDKDGHLDHAKMLEVLARNIENARHTLGPVNTLRSGGYKRSRSLCLPYQFLVKNQLSKPYVVRFE